MVRCADYDRLLRPGRVVHLVPAADDDRRPRLLRLPVVEPADGHVVAHLAEVLRAARRVGQARVDAVVVDAGLRDRAVLVVLALALIKQYNITSNRTT